MNIEEFMDNSINTLKSAFRPYYEETKRSLLEIFKEFVK